MKEKKILIFVKLILFSIFGIVLMIEQQVVNTKCHCMEYWDCFRSNGNFSTYCGLDESAVCCRYNQPQNQEVAQHRTLQSKCGRKGKDSGLIGMAEPTEWPWHAALLEKANHIYVCGASLIDDNWALTAAHCVFKYIPNGIESLTIRLGEHDISNNAEFHRHEEYDLIEIIPHVNYTNTSLWHDLALLKLRFPVTRRPNIDFICIPKIGIDFEAKRNCFVTGWGKRNESEKYSKTLKEIQVPIWPRVRCNTALETYFGGGISTDTVLCAGDQQHDACNGDGGGPLVCEDAGQWYQVGIVSFGLGCAQKDKPGIYTQLNKYEKWIRKVINKNK